MTAPRSGRLWMLPPRRAWRGWAISTRTTSPRTSTWGARRQPDSRQLELWYNEDVQHIDKCKDFQKLIIKVGEAKIGDAAKDSPCSIDLLNYGLEWQSARRGRIFPVSQHTLVRSHPFC